MIMARPACTCTLRKLTVLTQLLKNIVLLFFWVLLETEATTSTANIDLFLKPKIPRFQAFWESKRFDTQNDSSLCFSYLHVGTPFLFVHTEPRVFNGVPMN